MTRTPFRNKQSKVFFVTLLNSLFSSNMFLYKYYLQENKRPSENKRKALHLTKSEELSLKVD